MVLLGGMRLRAPNLNVSFGDVHSSFSSPTRLSSSSRSIGSSASSLPKSVVDEYVETMQQEQVILDQHQFMDLCFYSHNSIEAPEPADSGPQGLRYRIFNGAKQFYTKIATSEKGFNSALALFVAKKFPTTPAVQLLDPAILELDRNLIKESPELMLQNYLTLYAVMLSWYAEFFLTKMVSYQTKHVLWVQLNQLRKELYNLFAGCRTKENLLKALPKKIQPPRAA